MFAVSAGEHDPEIWHFLAHGGPFAFDFCRHATRRTCKQGVLGDFA